MNRFFVWAAVLLLALAPVATPARGKPHGACAGYVVDHVQAPKHGGRDDPSNMQWQTKAAATAKDKWE